MYGFLVVILIGFLAIFCYKKNLFHRSLEIILRPFDMKPGEFFSKMGVVGTVLASALVRNPEELYSYIGDQPGLGSYLNLGWWEHGPKKDWNADEKLDMRENCDELVRKVAEKAKLENTDDILDVGFGFGEQDLLLADEYNFKSLTGLNITLPQVITAKSKAEKENISHMRFLKGDAVNLPFKSNSFDKLLAIESPFHFHTRSKFFKEAKRVLRPGGRIVTADIINNYNRGEEPFNKRLFERIHNWYWQVPAENHATPETYGNELRDLNYNSVSVDDVTDNVIVPGIVTYIHWRSQKVNPLIRKILSPVLNWGIEFYESGYLRYVIASAQV